MNTHWKLIRAIIDEFDDQNMFSRERADYGTHFDFDTTSGKTDGKFPKGMKNHFDTAEFSS